MTSSFNAPEYFINRELSQLAFNRRVLEQAADDSNPLLERLKFLCIVSSNMDEFFEIRVAGLKEQIKYKSVVTGPEKMSPRQVFDQVLETSRQHLQARRSVRGNGLDHFARRGVPQQHARAADR